MARSTAAFERTIRLAVDSLRPPDVQRHHAAVARRGLVDHLRKLKGDLPEVQTFVDGRLGAPEESVKPYGVIRYEFVFASEAATFALKEAQEMSPVDSGAFRRAWFLMVDGKEVAADAIPPSARRIVLTNDRPYARKIEVGAMTVRVPPGIVDRLQRVVLRRFGNSVEADVQYIELAGGYRLKRDGGRKGRRKGDPLTYPALIMTVR